MDALLEGPQQQLPVSPTRYGHCIAVQFDGTIEVLTKQTACLCNDKIVVFKEY
jgi:hypothetical protein